MKTKLCMAAFFLFHAFTANGQELDTKTVKELINQAKQLDGQTVLIKGEVIGNIMPRGDFAWFNIEDSSGAIGVWAPSGLTKIIQYAGNYKTKGDIIEIEGTFVRADPELLGETGIRARRISLVKQGEPIDHPVNMVKAEAVIGLLLWVICLGFIRWTIIKRWRFGK